MKRESSSHGDDEDDAIVELHREAGERLDERPDPAVRAHVLEAARRNEELQRARAKVSSNKPPRSWPRSAAALLLVAVLTGLVVSQRLDGSRDLASEPSRIDSASRDQLAEHAPVAPTVAAAPAAPAATRGEHRLERRPFTRDRSAPPSRTEDARERESRQDVVASTEAPPAAAAKAAPFVATSAETWVAEIVRLRRLGDHANADAELARLLQSHPDVVVPPEALARP